MKKIVLLFACILATTATQAQTKVYLTGNGGATVNLWNPGALNGFVDSYNNYITTNVKTPLGYFSKTMVGFSRGFGVVLDMNKASIGFEYNKCVFTQNIYSEFTNGNGREIKLRFPMWNFNFDFSRKFGKHVDVGFLLGFALRSGIIYSYATYANTGNRSLGPEFWINGIYRGSLQSDVNLGLNLRINFLKYLAIQLRGYRSFSWANPKEGEEYLSAFSDASPGKNPYSEYFPKDMQLFETNVQNQSYDYESNVIPNIFTGWYLQASLLIKLNIAGDKK